MSDSATTLAPSPGRRRLRISGLNPGTALLGLDGVALALVWPAALLVASSVAAALSAIVYGVCALLALYSVGLYRRDAFLDTRRSLSLVPVAIALAVGGAGAVMALVGAGSWHIAAVSWICLTLCAAVTRVAMGSLLRRGVLQRSILVIGAGKRAWELLFVLERDGRSPSYRLEFLHNPAWGAVDLRLPSERVRYDADFDVLAAARAVRADMVVVAPDERRGMELGRLLDCKRAGFPLVQCLTFLEREIGRLDLKRMDLGFVLYADGFHLNLVDQALKRGFDLLAAGLLLLPALPILAAAMLAIRLEGPGPLFYSQDRITQDERRFRVLKLRTMRVNAEAGKAVWAAAGDRRVTRVGRILRRTRIDELPQLLNVLYGHMSFVGPRPERPEFVAELARAIPLYQERHAMKAGLTGWAQVNYPYGASVDDAKSKLSYDLYYIKNFSILFDALILLQTLRVVIWPGGVR